MRIKQNKEINLFPPSVREGQRKDSGGKTVWRDEWTGRAKETAGT